MDLQMEIAICAQLKGVFTVLVAVGIDPIKHNLKKCVTNGLAKGHNLCTMRFLPIH